jgi:acetyl esterase/lipase
LPGATDDVFVHALHYSPALMDYPLKAVAVCQKQTKTVPEKPATSRLFNACSINRINLNPHPRFILHIYRSHPHPGAGKVDIEQGWCRGEQELAHLRRINRALGWLPRFRISNSIAPLAIQTLLRASQLGNAIKTAKHGLRIESSSVVMDGSVPVAVRIIRPAGKAKGLVIDFHGGGWVIGNAQMDDDRNVAMVKECNVTVVSIDYRLAVSTPIEGLLEDCLAATRFFLSDNCKEFADLPVIVVGESAGGHLAAATLMGLKAWPNLLQRVRGAVLFYGVYDMTGTPSVHAAGPATLVLDGPGIVEAFRTLTPGLSDEERRQPPLSPLYGDFTDFAPALMFAGEIDPLLDDTVQLAERWNKSADVEVHLLPSSPHGFIHFPTAMAARVLAYSREWITGRISG